MLNYFTKQYLTAGENDFLKRNLVPYLQRRFGQEQEEGVPNPAVERWDSSVQTDPVPERKFDPISIFYEQTTQQPSMREIVAQVRSDMQTRHQNVMQSTLESLTREHRDATETLNKCLAGERAARSLERQTLQSQIEQLQERLKKQDIESASNVCTACKNDLGQQNSQFIQQLQQQIAELKQTNLEQTYRIAELEQYMNQCVQDLRLAEQERAVSHRRIVQLEESLKLHQQLLEKINLTQLLQGGPGVAAGVPGLVPGSYGFATQATQGTGSSVSSTNPSQIDVEAYRRALETDLARFRKQQEDVLMEMSFRQMGLQTAPNRTGEMMVFGKDTTPPAAPHIQYPLQRDLTPEQLAQLQLLQQYNMSQLSRGAVSGPQGASGAQGVPGEQNAKEENVQDQEPDKIDRNAPSVKQSDIGQIAQKKIESIMSSSDIADGSEPEESRGKTGEQRQKELTTAVQQNEEDDFDDFDSILEDKNKATADAIGTIAAPVVTKAVEMAAKVAPKAADFAPSNQTAKTQTQSKPAADPADSPFKAAPPKQNFFDTSFKGLDLNLDESARDTQKAEPSSHSKPSREASFSGFDLASKGKDASFDW